MSNLLKMPVLPQDGVCGPEEPENEEARNPGEGIYKEY